MMQEIIRLQLWVREHLVAHMDRAADGDFLTVAAILPLGMLFGALHAMTPGHSKTVLASYLIGSGWGAWKSLMVAGTLSLTHVGMAVLLALLGAPLVEKSFIGAGRAIPLEMISRGSIIAIGLWLVLRALLRRQHIHHEGKAFGVVAGLIPCPLTLMVMLMTISRGMPGLGLLWSAAMAGGVMLTLGGTALLAVYARDAFLHVWTRHGPYVQAVLRLIEGLAGLLLILFAAKELPL